MCLDDILDQWSIATTHADRAGYVVVIQMLEDQLVPIFAALDGAAQSAQFVLLQYIDARQIKHKIRLSFINFRKDLIAYDLEIVSVFCLVWKADIEIGLFFSEWIIFLPMDAKREDLRAIFEYFGRSITLVYV